MARSAQIIKNSITSQIIANANLAAWLNLNVNLTWEENINQGYISKTNVINIIAFIVANAIWLVELLWDDYKSDVNVSLANQKVHRLKWYEQIGLAFQYGHTLNDIINNEEDYYDNTNRTEEDINAAKVVKKISVNELPSENDNDIQMKIAGEDANGNLIQLTNEQAAPYYDAFKVYMEKVKDAGVYIEYINRIADRLKLSIRCYYNPLILTSQGNPLTGGDSEPVREAVLQYLKAGIDFNGILILNDLVDELQKIEGVDIPEVINAQYEGSNGDFIPLVTRRQPFSGYFSTSETDADELTTEVDEDGNWTKKGYLDILYIANN